MALGIYLRRFFIENIERDNLQLDTQYFGKFSIVADPDADIDSLYPHKIEFEATGGPLAAAAVNTSVSIQRTIDFQNMVVKHCRPIDLGRLTRLAHFASQAQTKKNLEALSTHLASLLRGTNVESDQLRSRGMKINLRIGHLIVKNG